MYRPKPLIEQHGAEKDAPTKRPRFNESPDESQVTFSRDRDMNSKQMSTRERNKIIQQAKELPSKFSHGSQAFL
jgi:hypothetical protein